MDESKVREEMKKVLDLVVSDVATIRSGRVTPALIEDLMVPVYAGQHRLKIQELATISVEDATTLVIEPWDKSIVGEISQGLLAANIGLNPVVDNEKIRISFPPLTSEDRQRYIKSLRTKIENGKIMIRQIRADNMRNIKRLFENKEISEDERFNLEKNLQKITDEFIESIDEIGRKKEEELQRI